MAEFADCMKLLDLFSLWNQVAYITEAFTMSIAIEAGNNYNFPIFGSHLNPFNSL